MSFLVVDLVDADRIFENHPVWALEIEKACPRGRMPTWTEYDRNALVRQVVVGAKNVVVTLDLMVVMDAGTSTWRKGAQNAT